MSCDTFGRTIDYLRISLTDRCNLRCVYCMPEEGVTALDHKDILRLEEVEDIVKIAAQRGIKHLRLTGGEPLVRKGIVGLIHRLKQIEGIESIALTTNGILLPSMAKELKKAGLDRVNISLDSLDETQYHAITRRGKLADALAGIEAALNYGFDPVKINVVAVRHLQQDFAAFTRMTLDKPLHVRFIEFMPIGTIEGELPAAVPAPFKKFENEKLNDLSKPSSLPNQKKNGIPWSGDDVISVEEIRKSINKSLEKEGFGALVPLGTTMDNPLKEKRPTGWGPATYFKIKGAQGTVGFISAMSNHFCASCNRLRLTADGKLRPCLFSDNELDIRSVIRKGPENDIQDVFDEALHIKPKEHYHQQGTKRTMSQVGG